MRIATAIATFLSLLFIGTAVAQTVSPPTAAYLPLTGGTVTGTITSTLGAANTGVLASTGYSLTGSDNTSMVSLAGTTNTSGVTDVFKIAITNTAMGAVSSLFSLYGGASGTTLEFKVGLTGTILTANQITAGTYLQSNTGQIYLSADAGFIRLGVGEDTTISRNAAGVTQFGTTANNALGSILATAFTFSGATQTLSNAAFANCTALTTVSNVIGCTASDGRLKSAPEPFVDGLTFIRAAKPSLDYFLEGTPYYDNGRTRLNLIAQDVQKVLPQAVIPIGNGYLQIDYQAITVANTAALKQLDGEVTFLKDENAKLRRDIAEIQGKLGIQTAANDNFFGGWLRAIGL